MELIYVGALALVGFAFLAVEVWKHLRSERLSRWHSEQTSEKTINVYADSNLARVDAQYSDLRRRLANVEGALGGDGRPSLSELRGRIDAIGKSIGEQDTWLTYATKRIAELSQELKNKASQEDVTVLNLSVTDAISTLSARIDACRAGAANPMPDASRNREIAEIDQRIREYRCDVERSLRATAAQLAAATMSGVNLSASVADSHTTAHLAAASAGAIAQHSIRFNEVEKRIAELDAEVRECLAHVRSRKTEAVQETAQAEATAEATIEQRGKTFVEAVKALTDDPKVVVRRPRWERPVLLNIDEGKVTASSHNGQRHLYWNEILATDWIISR
jgi:hypothetical protein